jgi:hypothetical protein
MTTSETEVQFFIFFVRQEGNEDNSLTMQAPNPGKENYDSMYWHKRNWVKHV